MCIRIKLILLLVSLTFYVSLFADVIDIVDVDLTTLKNKLTKLIEDGDFHEVLSQLQDIEDIYGHLIVDRKTPSLFCIQGVAYAGLFEHQRTVQSFENAVKYYPQELRAWINLGETHQMSINIPKAIEAFNAACNLGDESSIIRVLSAKGWAAEW